MKLLAKTISSVLHPLLMPTYIFAFAFYVIPAMVAPIRSEAFLPLLSLVFISTFLIPVLVVLILVKMEFISEVNIDNRKDRILPHIFSSLIYVAVTWFFHSKLAAVPFMFVLIASISFCMVAVTLINLFWKISAHSTAIGGLFSFFVFYYVINSSLQSFCLILVVLLVSGFVMASRLFLGVHSLAQVCSGFVLGTIVGMLGLFYVL
jgi:membrane-associated phospholipid phosphatase